MALSTGVMKSLALLLAVLCISSIIKSADGKRGCSSFGHSCFGGHGKRSDGAAGGAALTELSSEEALQLASSSRPQETRSRVGQEEIAAPRPVYPPTIRDLLNAGDDIIPIRNGGFAENYEETQDPDQLKIHLTPYLRHWLIAFRKAKEQKQNGDAYLYNNLI